METIYVVVDTYTNHLVQAYRSELWAKKRLKTLNKGSPKFALPYDIIQVKMYRSVRQVT